jgi:conjugal transfer pilus assembly protein TraI
VDPGITTVSVDDLCAANEALIDRIRLAYGSDDEEFDSSIVPLIEAYAAYVHMLPATPDSFFRDPGGLFRMGLEIGFYALQGTEGHIFSGRHTIAQRVELEPRWRRATFIAGLCAEAHRALSQLIVTAPDGSDWPAYLGPLLPWAQARGDRYFLRWSHHVAQETRSLGLFCLPHIVPTDTMQYLSHGNSAVVPHMLACISGLPRYREPNVIDHLVRRSAAVVIDVNLQSSADRFGKPQIGSHLERYLVDAMRRLVASGKWEVNAPKARLWFGTDGLFLIWPNSAADIVAMLQRDQLPGIPKSPETIADILLASGVIDSTADGGLLWTIRPPESEKEFDAVRLASATILLSAHTTSVEPLKTTLVSSGASPAAPQTGAAPDLPTLPLDDADPDEDDEQPSQGSLATTPGSPPPPASKPPTKAATGTASAPGAASAPGTVRFALNAPARLSPPVAAALKDIVSTLNQSSSSSACCTVPAGVFVPLKEFAKRSLDPSVALRAMREAGILHAGKGVDSCKQEFLGQLEFGCVILPKYVSGLDPAHFAQ